MNSFFCEDIAETTSHRQRRRRARRHNDAQDSETSLLVDTLPKTEQQANNESLGMSTQG